MRAVSWEIGTGEEVGSAVFDGLADAFEVIEGVVELVAVAGLVGEALLEAGLQFVAPAGELVMVLVGARHGRSGGGSVRGGGRRRHACDERVGLLGRRFHAASAERIFFANTAIRGGTLTFSETGGRLRFRWEDRISWATKNVAGAKVPKD